MTVPPSTFATNAGKSNGGKSNVARRVAQRLSARGRAGQTLRGVKADAWT